MNQQSGLNGPCFVEVVVATPAHAGLGPTLTYVSELPLAPGCLLRVPLGTREVLGIAWSVSTQAPDGCRPETLRPVSGALDGLAPLAAEWRQLVAFAARYYQRALGEVALAALPPALRDLQPVQLARRLRARPEPSVSARGKTGSSSPAAMEAQATAAGSPMATDGDGDAAGDASDAASDPAPVPSAEQALALAHLAAADRPVLLFGATGSGKTEVYLRAVEAALRGQPDAQALVMVPEINLTPQLEQRFEERLGHFGIALQHSALTPAQRLRHWIAAHSGRARIVLGTRMAVFASLPGLRLIVVDEEHDPSYKGQEGARYSARDLAVYRASAMCVAGGAEEGAAGRGAAAAAPDAQNGPPAAGVGPAGCRVLLGSATPSLESWHAAEQGRYRRLDMPSRIGGGALPALRLVDLSAQPRQTVIAPALLGAMAERVAGGEQVLVLINRRGYAPVLACEACGWASACPHCSAHQVFHKADRSLRCHHCGSASRVPRACPDCGNLDIQPLGRGTEQIEERLVQALAGATRADGQPLVVGRMDADTTRAAGGLTQGLAAMHGGAVDVLVGTQIIAKGHDFRRIGLVAGLNADSALFSSDFRAPERLFALLMQAAGRAGRDAARSRVRAAELWVQTRYPRHPLFAALGRHDVAGFAAQQLAERASAQMPPFSHQALLRAEARTQEAAQAFLQAAALAADALPGAAAVTRYPPVPMPVQRVANVERAQMLLESASRPALQQLLSAWQPRLHAARSLPQARGLLRWAIDVDPQSV